MRLSKCTQLWSQDELKLECSRCFSGWSDTASLATSSLREDRKGVSIPEYEGHVPKCLLQRILARKVGTAPGRTGSEATKEDTCRAASTGGLTASRGKVLQHGPRRKTCSISRLLCDRRVRAIVSSGSALCHAGEDEMG